MNPYIKELNDYLTKHTPEYGYKDVDSLLEMLYMVYAEFNPFNSEKQRSQFEILWDQFPDLTPKDQGIIFDIIDSICIEHERLAFLEGVRTGARLEMELT